MIYQQEKRNILIQNVQTHVPNGGWRVPQS
jgi:hypothetical protein